MDSLDFKQVALFPKKTSVAGMFLICILTFLAIFIISTLWNSYKDIDENHFPMVERSAINVRLIQLINYQFDLALRTKNKQVIQDLKINLDSLEQNNRQLAKKMPKKDETEV